MRAIEEHTHATAANCAKSSYILPPTLTSHKSGVTLRQLANSIQLAHDWDKLPVKTIFT